jgi:hypothetical protein
VKANRQLGKQESVLPPEQQLPIQLTEQEEVVHQPDQKGGIRAGYCPNHFFKMTSYFCYFPFVCIFYS